MSGLRADLEWLSSGWWLSSSRLLWLSLVPDAKVFDIEALECDAMRAWIKPSRFAPAASSPVDGAGYCKRVDPIALLLLVIFHNKGLSTDPAAVFGKKVVRNSQSRDIRLAPSNGSSTTLKGLRKYKTAIPAPVTR